MLCGVDKAPRLSISIVIWILSSDTVCQLNQIVRRQCYLNIPICSYEGCLLWGASHVAEVLAKVVVTGGVDGGKEGADLRKA